MITTDIINTSEYSIFYNYCEYTLTEKDFNFIKQAIQSPKEVFCTNTMFNGNVTLQERDEDTGEVESECRIDYTTMIVYRDSDVYLKIVEKHSEEAYEIQVDADYIEENIKDIVIEDDLDIIKEILAKDISDNKKIKEIKKLLNK